ncbi:MAG: hypothetical protein Kow0069_33710 [Promethearchaeota archaeon]
MVPVQTIKIAVMGPSGVGKTTLRKIFFDQSNPIELLAKRLEPTYGVETHRYELGNSIVVHDLAGQQLDDWLTTSTEVIEGSDLVLLLLDARDPLEENGRLVDKVLRVVERVCPNATVGAFFHKVDLLNELDLKEVEKYVDRLSVVHPGLVVASTSFAQRHFLSTFRSFVNLVKECLVRIEQDAQADVFIKLDILNSLIDVGTVPLETLLASINADSAESLEKVKELRDQGFLLVQESMNSVELSSKGKAMLEEVQRKTYCRVQEAISKGSPAIAGLILADRQGRPFFMFESEHHFFESLSQDPEMRGDPTLISMFFSAIGAFSKTIDAFGFSSIDMTMADTRICAIARGDMVGLFFTHTVKLDDAVKNAMSKFLARVLDRHAAAVDFFLKKGSTQPFEDARDSLVDAIKELNDEVVEIREAQRKFKQQDVLALYQELLSKAPTRPENGEMLEKLKSLVVRYLVSEEVGVAYQLEDLVKRSNLQLLGRGNFS